MPGSPVTYGCSVMLTPGAAGPPDSGILTVIVPPFVMASGMPLATTGSICMMVNSVTGVPYPVTIGPLASTGVKVGGPSLVRVFDNIPTPPGILTVLGPSLFTWIVDEWPP